MFTHKLSAQTTSVCAIVFSVVLFLWLPLIPATSGSNQWTGNGPEGGFIGTLAVDPANPAVVYAGTRGAGLFRSTDAGTTWQRISTPEITSVNSVILDPVHPSILYAGTSQFGIEGPLYKSVDGGGTWDHAGTGILAYSNDINPVMTVSSVAVDPQGPAILYAAAPGTFGGGIFKTTNAGKNWISVKDGSGASDNLSRVVVSPAPHSAVVYAAGSDGAWRSADGGASWVAINNGFPKTRVAALVMHPQDPAVLYAGTSSGLFMTGDEGRSWRRIGPFRGDVLSLAFHPQAYEILFAGTSGGEVFESTDRGLSWFSVSGGLPGSPVNALAIAPTNPPVFYAGTSRDGVFRSTTDRLTWTPANTGLAAVTVFALAIHPFQSARLLAGTQSTYRGGLFASTDSGQSWSAASADSTRAAVRSVVMDPSNPDIMYAGPDGSGVVKSVDGGETWKPVNHGLTNPFTTILAIDPRNPTRVYVATSINSGSNDELFKTEDGGNSWTSLSGQGGLPTVSISVLAVDPANSAVLYAGGSALYKSTNYGRDWIKLSLVSHHLPLRALAVDPWNGATIYAADVHFVFKSTNGGLDWTRVFAAEAASEWPTTLVLDRSFPAVPYVGFSGGSVYRSLDGGTTWTSVNHGLPKLGVNVLAVDPRNSLHLFAGTSGGLFDIVLDGFADKKWRRR